LFQIIRHNHQSKNGHTIIKHGNEISITPFTAETAKQKVQLAEDTRNSKNPKKVSEAYTIDTEWRNRDKFINDLSINKNDKKLK